MGEVVELSDGIIGHIDGFALNELQEICIVVKCAEYASKSPIESCNYFYRTVHPTLVEVL